MSAVYRAMSQKRLNWDSWYVLSARTTVRLQAQSGCVLDNGKPSALADASRLRRHQADTDVCAAAALCAAIRNVGASPVAGWLMQLIAELLAPAICAVLERHTGRHADAVLAACGALFALPRACARSNFSQLLDAGAAALAAAAIRAHERMPASPGCAVVSLQSCLQQHLGRCRRSCSVKMLCCQCTGRRRRDTTQMAAWPERLLLFVRRCYSGDGHLQLAADA